MAQRKVLVIYESSSSSLKDMAKRIGSICEGRAQVKIRPAKDVAIPELLAADAYFFGADTPASPEFAEIDRVLRGMNLAGRRCAFFSEASPKALDYLSLMTKDSELKASPERLLNSHSPDEPTISAWVGAVLA